MFMDIKDLKIAKASTPKTFNTYFKKISSNYEIPNWWKSVLNNVDPSTAYSDYVSSVDSAYGGTSIGNDGSVILMNWYCFSTTYYNNTTKSRVVTDSVQGSTTSSSVSYTVQDTQHDSFSINLHLDFQIASDVDVFFSYPSQDGSTAAYSASGEYFGYCYFYKSDGTTVNSLNLHKNGLSPGQSDTWHLTSGSYYLSFNITPRKDPNNSSYCAVGAFISNVTWPVVSVELSNLSVPSDAPAVSTETRTGSLCGDYTYTDSNNKLKEVKNIYIFDEANKILNNPQAGTSIAISSWTYDYTTKTYTATGTDNLTYIVSYSDNNVTIVSTSTASSMVAGATTEYVYNYGNLSDLTGVYKKATLKLRDTSGNVNILYPVTSIRVISEFPDFDTATDGQVLIKSGDGLAFSDSAVLDSPSFTGIPTAPTAVKGTNTTQLATTEFVYTTIGGTDIDIAAMTVWEEFNPLKPYVPMNKIYLNGSSYICKSPVTGGDPSTDTTHWDIIAKQGSDGASGVYIGDTEPIDPNIYVWIQQTGGSNPSIPFGGTTNQILAKKSNTDFDFQWIDTIDTSNFATTTQITTLESNKANKVSSATENNFATLAANGDLKDSGKRELDFAAASHNHTKSQITDFAHKSTHATGGTDALTPADIGAYTKYETDMKFQYSSARQYKSTFELMMTGRFTRA